MSEESWKLEKFLCRCCLNEGAHKNLAVPFKTPEGEEEIYSEMLIESININLTPVPGPMCSSTYSICEECILRLRDAFSFKQQVLLSEKRFQDLYNNRNITQSNSSGLDVKLEVPSDNEDSVKLEMDEDNFRLSYDDDGGGGDTKSDGEQESIEERKPRGRKTKAKDKDGQKSRKRARKPKDDAATNEKKGVDEKQNERKYTIVEHDGRKQYMCDLCKRVYMRQELFTQHYKHVHLKLRPKLRACYLCQVKVPGHMRTRHLEEAHGVPRPQCNACGKKFAYPFQVISHQKRFHMDEKLFPCPKCDMKFTIPSKLAQHSLKHSSLRPHKCEYCEKAFKWKKNLTTHIMMHLNDRRHVCSVCSEAFVQQTSLKYHLARKHPEVV